MKSKKLLIISTIIISSSIFTGCSVKFGINSRNPINNNPIESIYNVSNNTEETSNNNSTPIYREEIHKLIPISGIKNLDISLIASEVTIKAIKGEEITLDLTGSSKLIKNTSVNVDMDTLTIKENGSPTNFFNPPNKYESRKLLIGIPKNFISNVNIKCGAGAINIDDVSFSSVAIDGGVGTLNLSNIKFDNLFLNQGVGNTTISLNEKSGNMDIAGGVGELNLSLSEVGGNLTFEGGVGKANIDIPDNSPVKFITNTGLGKTKILATTSGEDTYTFDLNVGMGNVTVK